MEGGRNLLIIIDSNSIIHRAYHALPPLSTKKGEITNAVYGFLLVFLKAIREFHPSHIAACFDLPQPTFRHKKFKDYKGKRPPTADEIKEQIPKVKEVLGSFNVPVFTKEGFEADDIIGFIAETSQKKQSPPETEIIILSGDLDNLQLVNDFTKVYALRRGMKDTILYDENMVKEKYGGLSPRQLVDFKALRGDPSDNVPGVTGIGEKTATTLIGEFGSLENLYREIEGNSGRAVNLKSKTRELLINQKEQAFLSKDLVKIETDIPMDFDLERCLWTGYDKKKASEIFNKLEFYSLIKRLP